MGFSSLNTQADLDLDRKITLATEGFPPTARFCQSVLTDRNRLSKENALTVCDYIIALKQEINPRILYIRNTIQLLAQLSRIVGISKKFEDFTRNDVLQYLDKCRKSENEDPLHRWIGTYNTRRVTLIRFFKWLYYPDVANPDKRTELSNSEKNPKCIQNFSQLKRKEVSCYKPSDLWSQEDDLLFLKWVTNKRDRCYHMMSRDSSARPHELLALKIKNIMFNITKDGSKKQYAEVMISGKTGSRHVPLIQSLPYLKDWLSEHPSRNNPNSPLFVSLDTHSMGRNQLTPNGLYRVYKDYKEDFFPRLIAENSTIPDEDKQKIKQLLLKPWNPYIRRHTALTAKAQILKEPILKMHSGWSPKSQMHLKYEHWFGNESSESLLEAYGIMPKDEFFSINTLNPKICPNCNEGNTVDAKFCSKCKMIMSLEGYQEALESQSKKEDELKTMKEQFNTMQSQLQTLITTLGNIKDQNQINQTAQMLYKSGILNNDNK